MSTLNAAQKPARKLSRVARQLQRLSPRFLPFADAATPDLPLPRLLRLGLFQVSVGMAMSLMLGTLNRVMIVELQVAAWLVALMVALPIMVAPLRAFIGHRSDTYASAIGWRRVPYIGMGAFLQFAGLAIMPFALLLLSGDAEHPNLQWVGSARRAWRFCWWAPGCRPRRPRAWPWPPIWRSTAPARVSSR